MTVFQSLFLIGFAAWFMLLSIGASQQEDPDVDILSLLLGAIVFGGISALGFYGLINLICLAIN